MQRATGLLANSNTPASANPDTLSSLALSSVVWQRALRSPQKVDLLPKDMNMERVRAWVRDECRHRGLQGMEMRDVHLISCKTGLGVSALMKKVRERRGSAHKRWLQQLDYFYTRCGCACHGAAPAACGGWTCATCTSSPARPVWACPP